MIAPRSLDDQHDKPREPDGLMVFDGVCRLCSASVNAIIRLDRAATIRFTAVQSPYGRALCDAHGIDPETPTTFLFFDRGRALEASDAALALVARLPAPWCWPRHLATIPKPIRDALYFWIARRRYRLFGQRASCLVPSPAVSRRFIEQVPPA